MTATDFFAQRYRNKSALELVRLAAEQDNLVPEAREALHLEIARRPQLAEHPAAPVQATASSEAPAPAKDSLDGVEGWLYVYALGLIAGCLRPIEAVAIALHGGLSLVIALLLLGVIGWALATGVAIFRRTRSALTMVLVQLILRATIAVFYLGVGIALLLFSNESEGAAVQVAIGVLMGADVAIWYRYFCVSKRVRITFGRNL